MGTREACRCIVVRQEVTRNCQCAFTTLGDERHRGSHSKIIEKLGCFFDLFGWRRRWWRLPVRLVVALWCAKGWRGVVSALSPFWEMRDTEAPTQESKII